MIARTVDEWRRAVLATVGRIPAGRVATYGLVGVVAGRPLAARSVGNVMSACDDPKVPAHRVVHADGRPAFPAHRERLRREGVPFVGGRADLRRALWTPRLSRGPARAAGRTRRATRRR